MLITTTTVKLSEVCYKQDKTNLYEERDSDEYGKDEHAPQSVEMQRPPSRSIHQRNGDQRHAHHYDTYAVGGELGAVLRHPRAYEQACGVIKNLQTVNTP